MVDKANLLARHGLTLSRNVLRRLTAVGIVAQPQVSLEHQNLAKRYVIRGIESGGAVKGDRSLRHVCGYRQASHYRISIRSMRSE